jgi:hypothetical protein
MLIKELMRMYFILEQQSKLGLLIILTDTFELSLPNLLQSKDTWFIMLHFIHISKSSCSDYLLLWILWLDLSSVVLLVF